MVSEFRNHKTSEEDCWERLYILANEYLIFSILINCISPNVGRYYGLVTGPPPAMEATMEAEATMAMEAAAMEAATERF